MTTNKLQEANRLSSAIEQVTHAIEACENCGSLIQFYVRGNDYSSAEINDGELITSIIDSLRAKKQKLTEEFNAL